MNANSSNQTATAAAAINFKAGNLAKLVKSSRTVFIRWNKKDRFLVETMSGQTIGVVGRNEITAI